MTLMLWTADPRVAQAADRAGVETVGTDLERIGKAARQGHLGNARISTHGEADLSAVLSVLGRATRFARTNPLHEGSAAEIDRLLALGVEVLMLPYFRSYDEAARFCALVAGRARVALLVEHIDAVHALPQLVGLQGVNQVYVGLNDLGLSLGLTQRFAVLAGDLLPDVSRVVREAGLSFGFGGIGRAHDADLPLPTDLIYAQCARLGSDCVLLARSFVNRLPGLDAMAAEVARVRQRLAEWQQADGAALDAAHRQLLAICAAA
jgi:hypothetical protein